MTQLTQRCDLWRMIGTYDQGRTMTPVYTRLDCLRVPISSFDKVAAALMARSTGKSENFRPEGRESTDMILLAAWVPAQEEDEIRLGRRTATTGTIEPIRYVINGVRDYDRFGYQDTIAAFCTNMT